MVVISAPPPCALGNMGTPSLSYLISCCAWTNVVIQVVARSITSAMDSDPEIMETKDVNNQIHSLFEVDRFAQRFQIIYSTDTVPEFRGHRMNGIFYISLRHIFIHHTAILFSRLHHIFT